MIVQHIISLNYLEVVRTFTILPKKPGSAAASAAARALGSAKDFALLECIHEIVTRTPVTNGIDRTDNFIASSAFTAKHCPAVANDHVRIKSSQEHFARVYIFFIIYDTRGRLSASNGISVVHRQATYFILCHLYDIYFSLYTLVPAITLHTIVTV